MILYIMVLFCTLLYLSNHKIHCQKRRSFKCFRIAIFINFLLYKRNTKAIKRSNTSRNMYSYMTYDIGLKQNFNSSKLGRSMWKQRPDYSDHMDWIIGSFSSN